MIHEPAVAVIGSLLDISDLFLCTATLQVLNDRFAFIQNRSFLKGLKEHFSLPT